MTESVGFDGMKNVRLGWRAAFLLLGSICMAASLPAEEGGETFYKDILPIFQKYCIDCHHTGGKAPQSLEDYDLARSWLRTSRRTMREGTMPPWAATHGADRWRNALVPTEEELELFSRWMKAAAEPGDKADAPPPLDFSAEWQLGEPDRSFEMPEAVEVANGDPDVYRNTVFDPEFQEDTWLSAIELKPGSLKVVRQLTLSAVPPEVAASLPSDAFNLHEFDGLHDLALWNTGMSLIEAYPEGSGVKVPAGWKLVLQAHYKAGEEGDADRSRLGLHLADSAPSAQFTTATVQNRDFTLPADSYDYKVETSGTLENALVVDSILPRMHYLGLGMTVTATPPGGDPIRLIETKNYNYNFETLYSAVEPIELPAGTEINIRAFYENSPDNPNNPNIALGPVGYGAAPAGETLSVTLRGIRP